MENRGFVKDFLHQFKTVGEKVAFSLYDGNQISNITYGQFYKDILSATAYFKEKSIFRQHIAMIAPNSYKWFVVFFGVLASGNTAILLNPALPAEVLKNQIEKTDTTIILLDDRLKESLAAHSFSIATELFSSIQSCLPFTEEDVEPLEPDAAAVMMFTSGTTGVSKAAVLTLNGMHVSVKNTSMIFDTGNGALECAIEAVPLFHIGGLRGSLGSLYHGKTRCMGRGIAYLLMDMPIFNPTNVLLVPAIVENFVKLIKRISSEEERVKYFGTRLKRLTIAGATLKPDIAQYLMEKGFILDNIYAMTETTGSGTWGMVDLEHCGSIGKPCGDMQCRIQDGEILMKSSTIMKEYYKDPEETEKILKDGWLHTGDMGYCDEDGYYFITGRKKNIIILSNGENVNPEEIEADLGKNEAVLECLVFADSKGICADVYTENRDIVSRYIKEYNEGRPLYRQIYKVNYTVAPLPKTGSGKIKRKTNS